MANKFYQSEKWLRKKYLNDRLTPKQIADICGVEQMTIYRYLKKFGLFR